MRPELLALGLSTVVLLAACGDHGSGPSPARPREQRGDPGPQRHRGVGLTSLAVAGAGA
jgi:hypothetical protein